MRVKCGDIHAVSRRAGSGMAACDGGWDVIVPKVTVVVVVVVVVVVMVG